MSPLCHNQSALERIMKLALYEGWRNGFIKDESFKLKINSNQTANSWANSDPPSKELYKEFYANTKVRKLANK